MVCNSCLGPALYVSREYHHSWHHVVHDSPDHVPPVYHVSDLKSEKIRNIIVKCSIGSVLIYEWWEMGFSLEPKMSFTTKPGNLISRDNRKFPKTRDVKALRQVWELHCAGFWCSSVRIEFNLPWCAMSGIEWKVIREEPDDDTQDFL